MLIKTVQKKTQLLFDERFSRPQRPTQVNSYEWTKVLAPENAQYFLPRPTPAHHKTFFSKNRRNSKESSREASVLYPFAPSPPHPLPQPPPPPLKPRCGALTRCLLPIQARDKSSAVSSRISEEIRAKNKYY